MPEDESRRARIPFIAEGLTFLGMIVMAVAVFYSNSNTTNAALSALQTEMNNAKAADTQLRADTQAAIAQLRSDLKQVRDDDNQAYRDLVSKIDTIKEQISAVREIVARDGNRNR